MIEWLILGVVLFVFGCVMVGLWHESMRPLDEIDEWCGEVDEDLDVMYGGWRN